MWCLPTLTDEFALEMNKVLSTYEAPYDTRIPVVCVDETPIDLHRDIHDPIITKHSSTIRDYEYRRCGVANAFVITEPKSGKHYIRITKRRTRIEFAETLLFIAKRYPTAITIKLVMDNLNTHNEKSLIKRYGDIEGRRLWARFTPVYTPKHASWLNQAEIVIGMMRRSCIGKKRFPSIKELKKSVTPYFSYLRKKKWTISWKFSRKDAKQWLKTYRTEH